MLFRFPALFLCYLSGHFADRKLTSGELSTEVIEHQVLRRYAKVVEHLLNSFRHRTGTAHVVFDVLHSFPTRRSSDLDRKSVV